MIESSLAARDNPGDQKDAPSNQTTDPTQRGRKAAQLRERHADIGGLFRLLEQAAQVFQVHRRVR